jgi:hypothetical protein
MHAVCSKRPSMRMLATAGAAVVCLAGADGAAAQDEGALRSFFEGRRVTVRIDMPGTSDGIDVHVDGSRPIDYSRYGDRLKNYGVALHAGEATTVTLVKVKKDLIEFQLGGGGFGTFGDDASTSVYMPLIEKSEREKELERQIKNEDDSHRRRDLEHELDELRDRRERENRRIEAEKAVAEEQKRAQIAQRRLAGGSRFNLRYDGSVPAGVKPADVMAALAEYVDFAGQVAPIAVPIDDWAGPLRKGMTRAEAERELGAPVDSSARREGGLTVTTLVFVRSDRRITAEFVEDVLIRFAVASR